MNLPLEASSVLDEIATLFEEREVATQNDCVRILEKTLEFCAAYGVHETTFGLKSVGDPTLISRLKKGGLIKAGTVRKMAAAMAKIEADE